MDFLDDMTLEDLDTTAIWPDFSSEEREEARWRIARLCGALYALQQWKAAELSTGQLDREPTKRKLHDKQVETT